MSDTQPDTPDQADAPTDKRHQANEQTGGLAGLGAGVLAGASLGTALIPIPVVGTFAGALVGGLLGSQVGKTIGSAVLDVINPSTTARPASKQAGGEDLLAQLERLSQLRAQGAISEDEFRAAKAKLLGL